MRSFWLALLGVSGCFSPSLYATITGVRIGGSLAAPQPLGTTIGLSASASDSNSGPMTYKWEVQTPGSSTFVLLSDFDVSKTFNWTPNYTEGTYVLRLTVRDYLASTSAQATLSYQVTQLVTGSQPVAAPTANPLVALFSSPTCPVGSTMRVVFQPSGSGTQSITDWRQCHAGSMNFYIAGMEASSVYQMFAQVKTGGTITPGPQVTFTTGAVPTTLKIPVLSVPIPAGSSASLSDGIVLTDFASPPYSMIATDLSGNIIWYYPYSPTQLTRPVFGGTVLVIANGFGTGTGVWGPNITRQQILREIDLAGNTVHQTNADRVMEQLAAMGMNDPLGRFNHDAIRLGGLTGNAAGMNGYTVALGDVQRIFPAGTQGSTGPVDIVGAIIIVLDTNFQVVGYWNAFDHDCAANTCLSINRAAVRGEKCAVNSKGKTPDGCPPVLLSSPANDWLHSNSIQYLPSDGGFLMSVRDQDWVVKIDYNNGAGTGNILWRLGLAGDFTLGNSVGNPYPWFSAQHDAGFATPAGMDPEQIFTVFDNGVSRHARYGGDSRGQVWTIDQINMIATLTVNADLGAYSYSLGSAQMLVNGDYSFVAGNIASGKTVVGQNTEVAPPFPSGTDVYQFQGVGSVVYRGGRLVSFYNIQLNGAAGPE